MKTIEIYQNTFITIDVIFGTILIVIWLFCVIKSGIYAVKKDIENMWKYIAFMWIITVLSYLFEIIFN